MTGVGQRVLAVAALGAVGVLAGCGSSSSPSTSAQGSTPKATTPASPTGSGAGAGTGAVDLTFSGVKSFHIQGTAVNCQEVPPNGDINMDLEATDYPELGTAWYIQTQGKNQPFMKWAGPNGTGSLDFLDKPEYVFTDGNKSVRVNITADMGKGTKHLGTIRVVGTIDCPRV